MSTIIQDTARNTLVRWTGNALRGGYARGAALSPFTSPVEGNGYKRSALATSEAIRSAGGEFWLDPMTHALNMPRAGDFRFYDDWDLWSGTRGDFSTPSLARTHIERVFAVQAQLQAPALAPTLLVSYPDTPRSQAALDMSAEAVRQVPTAWLTIAGDQQFWSSGAELDAHVGALDQLQPAGWLLTIARGDNAMPPAATPEEIFGLMRTTYALSQDRPVRIAFGDVAALPAVAAGAESVGTGWDMRQRLCAYQDFEERQADAGGGGGAWYQRPTLRGLMGGLSNGEYDVLVSERPTLALRLTPGTIGPQAEQAFAHHATVLTAVIDDLRSRSGQDRVDTLRAAYVAAIGEWPEVQRVTSTRLAASRWNIPFLQGLELFRDSEGWI